MRSSTATRPHGAYVKIGDVFGYVPLRMMSDPPPRSAREVMKVGDAVTLVVASFAPARRSIDCAVPNMAFVVEPQDGEAVVAEAAGTAARRRRRQPPARRRPSRPAGSPAKAPAKKAAPPRTAKKPMPVSKGPCRRGPCRRRPPTTSSRNPPAEPTSKKATAAGAPAKKSAPRAASKRTSTRTSTRRGRRRRVTRGAGTPTRPEDRRWSARPPSPAPPTTTGSGAAATPAESEAPPPTRPAASTPSGCQEGGRRVIRLATWNVNSLKVRMPRVEQWLAEVEPDIVCLQETKVADDAFPALTFAARWVTSRSITARASGTASRCCRRSVSTMS